MSEAEIITGIVLCFLTGLLCIVVAVKDSDTVFESWGVKMWVKFLGRRGTRILYIVVGLFMCLVGSFILALWMGVLK